MEILVFSQYVLHLTTHGFVETLKCDTIVNDIAVQ